MRTGTVLYSVVEPMQVSESEWMIGAARAHRKAQAKEALADLGHIAQRFEIIAGERRWRASQQAGLSEIPVVIREVDDQTAMAMGLIENIQRDDLNPLEEAEGYRRLQEEFKLTQEQIARKVGKTSTFIICASLLLPAGIVPGHAAITGTI